MEADRERFEVGTLLRHTVSLMQANLWRVAIAVGVMAACGVFSDLGGADASAGTLLFNISALFFQFWLTIAVLNQTGTREAQAGGIGSLFAVSLIGQLCIILGLVAFVIPGIILVVRWSISAPIALSARVPAIDALRQSWRETDGHFWPILGVLAIVYLPLLLVSVGFALTAESTSTATSVILNVALSIMLIAGWHAAVAMFLAAQIKPQSLEEVFA